MSAVKSMTRAAIFFSTVSAAHVFAVIPSGEMENLPAVEGDRPRQCEHRLVDGKSPQAGAGDYQCVKAVDVQASRRLGTRGKSKNALRIGQPVTRILAR